MKKFTIVTITMFVLSAGASTQQEKRATLIQTYTENLEKLWLQTKDYPTDLYISSIGVLLPETGPIEIKAKASLQYLAAETALTETKEQLAHLIECKKTFDKYKIEIQKWQTLEGADKNCPFTGDVVATGVCKGATLNCKTLIHDFEPHYEKMMSINQKFTKFKFTQDDISSVIGMESLFWLDYMLLKLKIDCAMGDGPKKAHADFLVACKEFVDEEKKDNIVNHDVEIVLTKTTTQENGIIRSDYYNPIPDCKYNVPHPSAPLYFAFYGRNEKGFYCEGGHLVGIMNPKIEILLLISRTRAFYWLQMADYYEEVAKTNTQPETLVKIEKWEGPIKKFGREDGTLATKFQNTWNGKKYLNQYSLEFSEFSQLSAAYNSGRVMSASEKQLLMKFAGQLKTNRERAINLKRDVQDLLIKGKFPFGFDQLHF